MAGKRPSRTKTGEEHPPLPDKRLSVSTEAPTQEDLRGLLDLLRKPPVTGISVDPLRTRLTIHMGVTIGLGDYQSVKPGLSISRDLTVEDAQDLKLAVKRLRHDVLPAFAMLVVAEVSEAAGLKNGTDYYVTQLLQYLGG